MRFDPRWIVGKTIAEVDMRPVRGAGADGGTVHDPVIRFTDGSVIHFMAVDAEDADPGVAIIYTPPQRGARQND